MILTVLEHYMLS